METITSRQNLLVKHVVALHNTQQRSEYGQCIVQGLRACQTLHKSGITFVYLFFTEENKDAACMLASGSYICVSYEVMQKISTTTTPSGIVGVFVIPAQPDPSKLSTGLVLASITNPGNMGTLIRTAAAVGVQSVVVVEGCDPWSPKVIQASAGTIGSVAIFELSWDSLLSSKKNIPLCAFVVSGGQSPKSVDLKKGLLVIGNEAHGIPEQWLTACASKITLPMPGDIESLNAAIAGSIALYISYVGTDL
jgi:TrmH family RNA methyltransferase